MKKILLFCCLFIFISITNVHALDAFDAVIEQACEVRRSIDEEASRKKIDPKVLLQGILDENASLNDAGPSEDLMKQFLDLRRSIKDALTKETPGTIDLRKAIKIKFAVRKILISGDEIPQNLEPIFSETYIAHLKTCTPYTSTYMTELTQEAVARSIIGIVDGKCLYTEEGRRRETCRYPLDILPKYAAAMEKSNETGDNADINDWRKQSEDDGTCVP